MSVSATTNSHAEWLLSHGAVLDESGQTVVHFGDPQAELAAFSGSAAVVYFSAASTLSQGGADALDLLHRLSTNDLLSLEPGQAMRTVLTSERGRVIDLLHVAVLEENRLLLLSDAADAGPAVEWIDRFTIMEESEIRDASEEFARFAVIGPSAVETVDKAFGRSLDSGEAAALSAEHEGIALVGSTWGDLPRIDVVAPADKAEKTWQLIVSSGATAAGDDAFHTARISRGIPVADAELTDDSNPLEAGLKELVSFTKGCYVGQEVVARLDTYEKLQRRLVKLESASALTPGSRLTADGKRAGAVTSVAPIELNGAHLALGYARKDHWADGTQLECDGEKVTVRELP